MDADLPSTRAASFDRRTVLAATGSAVAAALAGCLGGGGPSATSDDWEYLEDGPDYGGWFDDTGNFEGTVDWTGRDSVTIDVGAGDDGRLFAPPAVRVDAGTTITWEWSGAGGPHNVVAEDGSFDSGSSTASGDATYEYTPESTGTYRYVCVPHESMGMVGAVDVV
ncbi:halocyanin domain-containing protein [Salinarchaeum sp. Harcht-Bsk1]|uniref:halocyanin domain-containing protein n=1 Tax=Salinarchaeum sp. Harcht-Bsk1 TaxID=1333523 RepID=UPI0006781463|nr:halocyanin domain-containing protein [Salinarchaeum sp. Harcht-Bsk1]